MADVNKALKPVESVTIAPLNEGSDFRSNSYILFRLSSADLSMWLTNVSYLRLSLEVAARNGISVTGSSANATSSACYIRNAANLFKDVQVYYGGDLVYQQPYNIEQNTLRMLNYGETYLRDNYATYTTASMVNDGSAYLKLSNGTTSSATAMNRPAQTITDIIIPVNQLIPMFEDCDSHGFPMRGLRSQIEIRLYIAEPYRYLVDWSNSVKDFTNGTCTLSAGACAESIQSRFPSTDITLTNVRLFCSHYVPDQNTAQVIDDKCRSAEGWGLRYTLWQTALRQMPRISPSTNAIPFSVTTNNTKSMLLYCHKAGCSPSVMYRPFISSLYMKFGPNQLPYQPIAGNPMETPFEYKFTSDDVLT